MRKISAAISTTIFLILVLFVFISIALTTSRIRHEVPEMSPGYGDLSNFDFIEKLAYISHTSFLYYKNELYSSNDFTWGQVQKEPAALTGVEGRFDPGEYGTYRLVLRLPVGRTYGLSSYSSMYSQRLFINGTEYATFGVPGKSRETTIPKTGHYTVYFTPQKPETEIIIQFANFNHADYGGIVPQYLGLQEQIAERDAVAQLRVYILVGCTVTVFLFFLGMFFFFTKRYSFLWFSLSCLSIGLRALLVNEKAVMLLLPDLPWRVSIGLEYMVLILLLLTFLLYINSMFHGAVHKLVLRAFGLVCALYAMLVLFSQPIVYTSFILWFQLAGLLTGIYIVAALLYNAIYKKENRRPEHILIFTGILSFIALSALDIQIHRSSGYSLALGLSEVGMLVLVFINMIALALQFSRTDAELDEARRRELEMQETNELLDRMSQLKSDFMSNISHEMRTPLTIIASYAGLTSMEIKRDAVNEKTLANLSTIKREAIRLAAMVEQLKEIAMERETKLAFEEVEAKVILKQAADFCEPICNKNKNQIIIDTASDVIFLHVNVESIFQTLVNLIINANRHTKKGTIRICLENCNASTKPGFVKATVSDDGDGIDPLLLPDLFKRGVSGDGSSGLGLAICKEIIEEHGGEIWVESGSGKGAAISFTLLKWKGATNP